MIALLHGYLLDGSGSNLWTRSVVRALCQQGRTVHLVCQEPHPERYDFVAEAYGYGEDGEVTTLLDRAPRLPGRCIVHRPELGTTLPVYVWDEYEDFERVVPMIELGDVELEEYLHRNVVVVDRVVRTHGIRAMHANHAVLMSVVAQRVSAWTGVPYAVMPHGSALEYAVRHDERLRRLAAAALTAASKVFVIGEEIVTRLRNTLGSDVRLLDRRVVQLDLGVDTAAFRPIDRAERADNLDRVLELLKGVPRGRTAEQQRQLSERLRTGDDLALTFAAGGEYAAKQPDHDIEAKLAQIDPVHDRILAFVGRLIPAKGPHALLAALPFALRKDPRLRVLVIGHGPLREPLEAMVLALARGDRMAHERIIAHMQGLEASGPQYVDAVRHYHERLVSEDRLDEYWQAAHSHVRTDRVLFCGYLTHREMAWLLPCCDAVIVPSMVKEAGPLVFLEALASGAFPVGTGFGGMAAKLDVVEPLLAPEHGAVMRLRPAAEHIVSDIAAAVPEAVRLGDRYRSILRSVAEAAYDWRPVARRLGEALDSLGS